MGLVFIFNWGRLRSVSLPNTATPCGMLRDVHPISGKESRSHTCTALRGRPGSRSTELQGSGIAGQCRCGGGTAARRDGVRVFRHIVWLEVGSGKVALPRPAHQRVPRRKHARHNANRWADECSVTPIPSFGWYWSLLRNNISYCLALEVWRRIIPRINQEVFLIR